MTPAPIGNTTRGIRSLRAMASACAGPEPPNATMDEPR